MILAEIAIIVLLLPGEKRFKYEYEKGKIWMHPTLAAPFNFPIEKTDAELKNDKSEIISSVLPVFVYDSHLVDAVKSSFKEDFYSKWGLTFKDNRHKNHLYQEGLKLLNQIYTTKIIELNGQQQKKNESFNLTIVENNIASNINSSELYTRQQAVSFLIESLAKNYVDSKKEKEFLLQILQNHIRPNVLFDEDLTRKMEDYSIENLSSYLGMVAKNEIIINQGDIITDAIFSKLESLRKIEDQVTPERYSRLSVNAGQVIIVTLSISLLIIFLYFHRPGVYNNYRKLSLILLIIVCMLAILSWVVRLENVSVYFVPYCMVPIILRLLFDSRLALTIHILVILLGGFFVPNSFEFAYYQISAGMVAIYSIRNLTHRSQYIISAAVIFMTYLIAFLGISFLRGNSIETLQLNSIYPFAIGVILSLLAYPMIYIFEHLFGITSDITLMELSNTNNSLMKELASKAPGTFQHSMQVADLAEAVIFKIGGNPLLVRTGALYHDIGKIKNPQFFIENQKNVENPHHNLSYEESAKTIIRHVSDGVEMAKKEGLPKVIIDFIRTHHGTTRVDYFYQSLLKNFPDKIFDEQVFRYPGPIPFSKETGVLMLADSVEAAARSLKNPDVQNISSLVDNLINYKIEQKQLNNTDISLRDIENIKRIFKHKLMSIYHVRVEYEGILPNTK